MSTLSGSEYVRGRPLQAEEAASYADCRTGKGNLEARRQKLGEGTDERCRWQREKVETVSYVGLACTEGEWLGRRRWGGLEAHG